MPAVTKADVLSVLEDRIILKKMRFSVRALDVNEDEYQNVADYIRDGDIQVVPGTESLAFYDPRINTIITQKDAPKPLNVADRAQILHECTHAIADINGLDILRLDDEVAAYIAQLTYMELTSPSPPAPPGAPKFSWSHPRGSMVIAVKDIIAKYGLLDSRGFGARIGEKDIWDLEWFVQRMPEYAKVGSTEKDADRGVPSKNQMRSLRAAMRRAKRYYPQPAPSPSPRLEIF